MMLTIAASSMAARLGARSSTRPAAALGVSSSWKSATAITRGMGMRVREIIEELPPNFSMDAISPPPHGIGKPYDNEPADPMAYVRKPVSSAHAIDLSAAGGVGALSKVDSAAFGPGGSIAHGRYGTLLDAEQSSSSTVPLEYLALLRPAAEGAAALREIIAEAASSSSGTVLVYGASRPAGMSAVQLATAEGHAVVAVIDGGHSGNDDMVDAIKGLTSEPGTAVSEEYALCKANFRDLVERTVTGEDYTSFDFDVNQYQFLSDFKKNLLDYVEYYPSDLPAAVDAEVMKFVGKEKDRANFKVNMAAYLSQFQPGADPIDPAVLDANFTVDQYCLFKKKFGIQTTAVISGGDDLGTDTNNFAPADIVRRMCYSPEETSNMRDTDAGEYYPFEFSTRAGPPPLAPILKGGPILGAIIEVTPDLTTACEAVASGKTLRAKAEALQFLTESQKNAYAAASSVFSIANKAGAPVRTVGGSLPGIVEIKKPTEGDIRKALDGMEIRDDGSSRLNYFIQVYRAGDWPVYEDYAIHRAKEPLSGPRQIVVTK
ncbi:hypothetical protein ACHAXA_009325 [Cyclostephanos tholiformis]|uniref:Uncharacterized protein n=1 Tax=Cyclostephanos tholiformis TaxID=382380 RepID=A0ABD3SQ34_9STRA